MSAAIGEGLPAVRRRSPSRAPRAGPRGGPPAPPPRRPRPSRRAVASPIPDEAPVTTAYLSLQPFCHCIPPRAGVGRNMETLLAPRTGALAHRYGRALHKETGQLRVRRRLRPRVRRAAVHVQRGRLPPARGAGGGQARLRRARAERGRARRPRQPGRQRRDPRAPSPRSASTSTRAGRSSSARPTARSCTGCADWSSAAPGSTSASRKASSTSSSARTRRASATSSATATRS